MAQNDVVVVGIDVAKDKVDGCIRKLSLRQTFPSTQQGHRKLIAWLRKHEVTKAVMEASGGYERDWARALRDADIDVRIVDPKRVRAFALSAGRLAKNDVIDAEMIAWFAETFSQAHSQARDAAHEARRNTGPYNTFKHLPEDIAVMEPLVAGSGEHRVIRQIVLNAQAAEPAVGQVDLHFTAQGPL